MASTLSPADAYGVIIDQHTNELVVTGSGTATQEWHRIFGPDNDHAFHMHTMGLTSSFGLGLALAQPDRGVWAFEGDGGLLLNFGTMATMGQYQPANLTYFLISNRRHRTIDGPPVVAADVLDYTTLCAGVGITRVFEYSDLDSLQSGLPAALQTPGFKFIVLEVNSDRPTKPIAPYEAAEIKYRFGRYVEQETGAKVFGPRGY